MTTKRLMDADLDVLEQRASVAGDDDTLALLAEVRASRAGAKDEELAVLILKGPKSIPPEKLATLRASLGRIDIMSPVDNVQAEGRWEKRARAMHTWLLENVLVPVDSRWRSPEGDEFVAEERKGEGGPFAFKKASGTGYFVSEDHPATLGWKRVLEDEDLGQPIAALKLAKSEEPCAVRWASMPDWVLQPPKITKMPEMVSRALEARDAAHPPEQDADAAMRTSTDGPPEGAA